MARGYREDPAERDAEDAIDPGDPNYAIPFNPDNAEYEVAGDVEYVDPSVAGGEPADENEELPEGATILYDEDGNAFLGIPIDPSSIPDMEDEHGEEE